jgi:hypothetical protein
MALLTRSTRSVVRLHAISAFRGAARLYSSSRARDSSSFDASLFAAGAALIAGSGLVLASGGSSKKDEKKVDGAPLDSPSATLLHH